ncbi:DNA-binding response regulator [Amycolatopsis sp. WAC 01376]|uniref:response regulator transcription factor n=1 Tax=Amycolatopsis sp. WAC 01376 TaxID=2203195 RepID=UPI000F7842A2|nr:response regulator transcription factor [Amycolatopsis sp. WAC 01376]RSM63041.1 DNA-binding response regulator [Amycolatopsis sp. WAC 01376]
MPGAIRIFVAEDMAVLRDALTALLALEPDIEVVGETDRGDQVPSLVASCRPDVLVLDIDLPGQNGLTLARHLQDHRILVLSALDRPGIVREALDAGVRGFLPKGASVDALTAAIRQVAAGGLAIAPDLLNAAMKDGKNPLSEHEQTILRRIATGATAADISRELHMAIGTARNHTTRVLQKLGARNQIEAIRTAERYG